MQRWSVTDPGVLKWLDERTPEGSHVTGFDPPGCASVWIVHAMYETAEVPAGITTTTCTGCGWPPV